MCDRVKNISEFGRDASRYDGRYTYCKLCRLKPNEKWLEEDELFHKNLKKCTKCAKVVPVDMFDADKTKRLGLASACKSCQSKRRREKHAEFSSRRETLEYLFSMGKFKCNKCDSIKALKEFAKSGKTKFGVHRTCKECSTPYNKNPDPTIRDYVVWEVYTDDNFMCYLCDEPVDTTKKHPHPKSPSIDHVHPISRGGLDIRSNVRLSCWECNLRKQDMTLEEYQACVAKTS